MATILIADDDPFLIKIYSTYLNRDQHQVFTCTDGQTALETAIRETPDVIVLDIMLPRMNGLDVLEELRSNKSTKDIPVICLSNLVQEDDQKLAMDLGAQEFIIKARLTPNEIIQIIHKYIKPSREKKKTDT